jgi:hypothetical protein
VLNAKFGPRQIKSVIHAMQIAKDGRLLLDQNALGKLLIEFMSPETCRKVVAALASGGLLERRKILQVQLIAPTQDRVLESLFREHLLSVIGNLSRWTA